MNELILVNGYDNAILGVIDEFTFPRVVYSKRAMIDILIQEKMKEQDAIEHLEYNVWNAYVANNGPLYINDLYGTGAQDLTQYVFGL
jgi:hypothetical protein